MFFDNEIFRTKMIQTKFAKIELDYAGAVTKYIVFESNKLITTVIVLIINKNFTNYN